ncbi:MAG: response regulator [Crocinitomicaceae bacterium]|nr:response regulator [Crocinitomicaceae bacterium]
MKTTEIKIFIVEDDKFYAELIRNTLVNDGYKNIQLFDTGKGCLDYKGASPNIVILDHMLDQMDGLHVLREIKSADPLIQVIFLSAQENMDVVIDALKYGAIDYIEKTEQHAMTRLLVMMDKAIQNQKKMWRNNRIEKLKGWFLIK